MVDVAHPERAAVVAREEDLVRAGDPHGGLVRERERRVRRDGADGRVRAENLQEVLVEDLEERRAGVRRVEELVRRGLAERAVVSEDVECARVHELCRRRG